MADTTRRDRWTLPCGCCKVTCDQCRAKVPPLYITVDVPCWGPANQGSFPLPYAAGYAGGLAGAHLWAMRGTCGWTRGPRVGGRFDMPYTQVPAAMTAVFLNPCEEHPTRGAGLMGLLALSFFTVPSSGLYGPGQDDRKVTNFALVGQSVNGVPTGATANNRHQYDGDEGRVLFGCLRDPADPFPLSVVYGVVYAPELPYRSQQGFPAYADSVVNGCCGPDDAHAPFPPDAFIGTLTVTD